MFQRKPQDQYGLNSKNGAKWHVMPDGVPAVAAADGVVWSAGWTRRGYAVVIDHAPRKIATYYAHLEELAVKQTARARSGERVRAGQPLGVVGGDPTVPPQLKHLHFEIWLGGPKDAIDPAPIMRGWEYLDTPLTISKPNPTLRNVPLGLSYRSVGGSGEPYPDWVRDLDGQSGVYVIREHERGGDPVVAYVGSSRGHLYATLTRHFQTWTRSKTFWRGQFSAHDPGMTYDRDRVDVAVHLTAPDAALGEEAALIAALAPRDNLLGQVNHDEPAEQPAVDDSAPF